MPPGPRILQVPAAVHEVPWCVPLWVTVACLAVWLVAAVAGIERGAHLRRLALVLAAGALTRGLAPAGFLQVDQDDVRAVAIAMGADPSALPGTFQPTETLRWLLGVGVALGGGALGGAWLPSRIAGALLPGLGWCIAHRWHGDVGRADVTAVLLLGFTTLFGATGVSAEMSAAALSAVALLAGLEAMERTGVARVVAATVTVTTLVLGAILKEELMFLLGVVPLCLLTRPGRDRSWTLAVGIGVTSVAIWLAARDHDPSAVVASRSNVLSPWHMAGGILTWVFVNPPLLPTKLAFLATMGRRWGGPGGLHAWVLGFVAVFLTAFQQVGSNQWRYALNAIVPMSVLVAGPLWALWHAEGRGRKALLAAFAGAELLTAFAWWMLVASPRADDLAALRSLPPTTERRLVLYVPHRQDRAPASLAWVAGVGDILALDEAWPSACEGAVTLSMIGIRTDLYDLALNAVDERARFRNLDTLDADLSWLAGQPVPGWLAIRRDTSLAELEAVRRRADPAGCAAAEPAWRAALAAYDDVQLLVGEEVRWARTAWPPELIGNTHGEEFVDRATRWMEVDPQAGIVVPVDRILGVNGPLWERRR